QILQLNLTCAIAQFAEELFEQFAQLLRVQAVEVMLALALAANQFLFHQRQMMADGRLRDGWLRQGEQVFQGRDAHRAVSCQGQADLEARRVGQNLESLDQFLKSPVGNLG